MQQLDTQTPAQLVALLTKSPFSHEMPPLSRLAYLQLEKQGKEALSALLDGLKHADGKVRPACALLLDHVADDRCIEPLKQAMRHDPQEAVRRCAMHALVCDGCKECPLNTDVVGALIEAALKDRSVAVRRRAVFYLSQQPPEGRAELTLETLIAQERDGILLQRAHRALAGIHAADAEQQPRLEK
jgi:HEAT repeat protein